MTPDKVEAALALFRAEVVDHRTNFHSDPVRAAAWDEQTARLSEALATITSALAERERDAARYRWLRDASHDWDVYYPTDKMPEMPEAPAGLKGWLSSYQQDLLREYIEIHGRACYLAGIADARACVGGVVTYTDLKGPEPRIPEHNAYNRGVTDGMNGRRETILTNLTALEQEAKK